MTANNRAVERIISGRRWLSEHGPRGLSAVGFLIVHLTGAALAIVVLIQAWVLKAIPELLVDTAVTQGILPNWLGEGLKVIVLLCLALFASVVLLAVLEAGKIIRRWWQGKPEPDIGLRVRVGLYIAVACIFVNAFFFSTLEGFSGPFRLRNPIFGEISAVLAYGGYALWTLLLPRLRSAVSGRLRVGLDVIGMNAVLVLVLAEVGLRVVATFWPSPLLITDEMSSQVRRQAGGRLPPGTLYHNFPINRGGHYDTEFVPRSANRGTVVVSIGDSFSYGTVPHAYHFTTVAERESRSVEIYNMGYPWIGPQDYLYLVEHEAVPLQPDLVVVQIFVGNDVTDVGLAPRGGPPRWYDADNYLLAIVWHRLQIIRRAEPARSAEVVEQPNMTREELAVVYPWLADPLLEKPMISRDIFLEVEARNARAVCLSDYEGFFHAVAEIERAAADVPLAFVLIPDEFQVEDDVWKEVIRRSDQPLDRDRPQRLIVDWMERRGRPVLDLLPILRAVPPMEDGRRHLYHLQDTHFNARGNEIAGRALARFVDSLLSADATSRQRAVAPVSLPLHLDIGDSAARRWMGIGWHGDEESNGTSFTWSDGTRSTLAIPLPTGTDIRMDFNVSPYIFQTFLRDSRQSVSIRLNGITIEDVPLRPGLQKCSVVLPADALRDGLNILEFRYAYARAPKDVDRSARDRRALAVAWYSIDFTPLSP